MYHAEGAYLIAMITSSPNYNDEFSFFLSEDMFENSKNDSEVKGQVRTHLITYVLETELRPKRRLNRFKDIPMRNLLKHIHYMLLDE